MRRVHACKDCPLRIQCCSVVQHPVDIEDLYKALNHHSPMSTRVLLVEDDELQRLILTNMLHQLDCTVDIAINGYDAVTKFDGFFGFVF